VNVAVPADPRIFFVFLPTMKLVGGYRSDLDIMLVILISFKYTGVSHLVSRVVSARADALFWYLVSTYL
jgi:hypothetical protein